MTKSRGILAPRHRWTKRELAILRRRYPHDRTTDIAEDLRVRVHLVYAQAGRMGLHKSKKFRASDKSGRIFKGGTLGKATQFQPGQVPKNKGLRRPGWHRGRMRETQFKKGQLAGHALQVMKPIGAERITKDGYLERKVNNDLPFQRRWKGVHRIVWEEAHGPIPPHHAVGFLPGKFSNVAREITVDRLELVARAELARRNRLWTKYPKPLASAIHVLGQVKRRIRQNEKAHATPD